MQDKDMEEKSGIEENPKAEENAGQGSMKQEENPREEEKSSLEEEWAQSLQINFKPPKLPHAVPPPLPESEKTAESRGYDIENPTYEAERRAYDEERMQNRSWENYETSRKDGFRPEHKENYEPMPSTYLIWSILTTIFCCFIPGIIAIVFSSQVSSKYYAGDVEGARRASRNAEIWIIVSFVLGVLTATLYVPLMMIF